MARIHPFASPASLAGMSASETAINSPEWQVAHSRLNSNTREGLLSREIEVGTCLSTCVCLRRRPISRPRRRRSWVRADIDAIDSPYLKSTLRVIQMMMCSLQSLDDRRQVDLHRAVQCAVVNKRPKVYVFVDHHYKTIARPNLQGVWN
jgi:hypothetical protein